jgi:hypothetical protein
MPQRCCGPINSTASARAPTPQSRVTLSTGRDITLEPKQDGPPLNYFLNPYAEADGKPVKTEKTWSYQDLN